MAVSRWSRCARILIHTEVPGTVTEILADEGQPVAAGGAFVATAQSGTGVGSGQADADLRNASARATQASLSYENFGPAERERQQVQRSATAALPKR